MGTTRKTGGIRGATELRERIEEWRRTRERRCQMPADLWDGAVSLARVHGPYQVSRALGVHYGALKSRLEGVKSTPSKKRSDCACQASSIGKMPDSLAEVTTEECGCRCRTLTIRNWCV